jgi:hypothetical protein
MFGLEDDSKGKKTEDFVFDLEKELESKAKHKSIIDLVENRIQKVKEILRTGDNKDEFDKFGALLHGYTALLKVTSRVNPKS